MGKQFEDWDKSLSPVVAADTELNVADINLRRQVNIARSNGHSWTSIGLALGVSRQRPSRDSADPTTRTISKSGRRSAGTPGQRTGPLRMPTVRQCL